MNRSIFVVLNDKLTARLASHRLEREGFEVVRFTNGLDALSGLLCSPVAGNTHRTVFTGLFPTLMIIDVVLPGMGGFELLSSLRRVPAYADLPILMLTFAGRERDVVRALSLGATDYMLKPFSTGELVDRVQLLIREHESAVR